MHARPADASPAGLLPDLHRRWPLVRGGAASLSAAQGALLVFGSSSLGAMAVLNALEPGLGIAAPTLLGFAIFVAAPCILVGLAISICSIALLSYRARAAAATLWVLQPIGAAVVLVFSLWARHPIIGGAWLGASVAAMVAIGLTSRRIS